MSKSESIVTISDIMKDDGCSYLIYKANDEKDHHLVVSKGKIGLKGLYRILKNIWR